MKNVKRQKFGGRTKGTPNKNTTEIRNKFQLLIENNIDQLQEDLEEMSGKDRLKYVLELSRFVIPTLKATELTSTSESDIQPILINFID